jgi:hypothetical protein
MVFRGGDFDTSAALFPFGFLGLLPVKCLPAAEGASVLLDLREADIRIAPVFRGRPRLAGGSVAIA